MTINTVKHFHAHAKETGDLPFINARLHQPCRGRMPKGVRCHLSGELCETYGAS